MKKIDSITWFFIASVALFALAWLGLHHDNIYGCKPCAYINYKNEIEPGYEVQARLGPYCWSCDSLTRPQDDRIGISMTKRLMACPKEYKDAYNVNAKKLNSELISKGYKPKFEIVEGK